MPDTVTDLTIKALEQLTVTIKSMNDAISAGDLRLDHRIDQANQRIHTLEDIAEEFIKYKLEHP